MKKSAYGFLISLGMLILLLSASAAVTP